MTVGTNVSPASPSGNDHWTTLEHLLSHVPVDDSIQNNSPFSHDHSPASSHPLSIDIIPHEPLPLQEIDSIHDTTSSSHSSGLQSNSSLSFDQAQQPRHPMVTRAQHGIHKPNPRYALIFQCGDIPDEPRNIKITLQHDGWKNAMLEELDAL